MTLSDTHPTGMPRPVGEVLLVQCPDTDRWIETPTIRGGPREKAVLAAGGRVYCPDCKFAHSYGEMQSRWATRGN
jgi:hypothetical protein